MSLVTKKKWYLDYLLIIVGTGLMALAINSVFDASGLVTGGFSGIAILVKRWTGGIVDGGIPLWLTNITLNIPLFLLCKKSSDRRNLPFNLACPSAGVEYRGR